MINASHACSYVEDSCEWLVLRPTTTVDIRPNAHPHREREKERAGSLLSSPFIFYAPVISTTLHSCCNARASDILCPEYTTRSMRINWHYDYDMVSLATDHCSSNDLSAPCRISRGACFYFLTRPCIMHRKRWYSQFRPERMRKTGSPKTATIFQREEK